jgi:hypothetical protein
VSGSDDGEITIFLSYARDDDAVYGMIRPFKQMVGHFVYAKSGRKIKAFLDQDSIEWGEVWRDRLDTEILGASVFIPLLSASYLDSAACRMEFNRFQSNATALGVKELLLPVLLIHAPAIFNENSTDDVVREAAARQWEVIEDAILSDAGSASWKTTMARLADRFVRSYEAAESKLASLEQAPLASMARSRNLESRTEPSTDGQGAEGERGDPDLDGDDSPGLAELMDSLQSGISALTASGTDMGPAIESLGNAVTSAGQLPDSPTPQQVQAWSLRSAKALQSPAEEISLIGERMFDATKSVDFDLQRFRRIAIDVLPINSGLAQGYNDMVGQLEGLEVVSTQLNSLLDSMKPAEYISVPLRKSLRPARRGLTRVTDSIRLIKDGNQSRSDRARARRRSNPSVAIEAHAPTRQTAALHPQNR